MLGKMMTFENLKNLAWIRDSGKVSGCLFVALFFMLVTASPAQAINLMVENTTFTDGKIRFDISWDNSWRVSEAPANWDAAWVFAKWKHKNGTEWFHCTLSTADDEHTTPTGSQIEASFTKDNNGKGSNDWNGVELRWNYGIGGMADDAAVDVKVFAIEMVYVPQGRFFLGDDASIYAFYDEAVATNYAAAPEGNAAYRRSQHLIKGPLRGGIFATATSTRAEAGATYYGIMEMSGNLWEKPVTLANAAGRRFKGTHGDGTLTKDGFADISNWPGYVGGKNSGVTGAGSRGGSWYTNATHLRISGRQKGGFAGAYRINTTGFRCVRSAW